MRVSLALLAVLALAAQPALAQGKTKASPAELAVGALEVCEMFARGEGNPVELAVAAGWDAYDQTSESPFVRSYAASRELPGLGWGDLFSLVETYPGSLFGYCRIDFVEPVGSGKAAVEAIAGLERYEGELREENGGHYASLSGGHSLLLTHWDQDGFVIQLTTLTPEANGPEENGTGDDPPLSGAGE